MSLFSSQEFLCRVKALRLAPLCKLPVVKVWNSRTWGILWGSSCFLLLGIKVWHIAAYSEFPGTLELYLLVQCPVYFYGTTIYRRCVYITVNIVMANMTLICAYQIVFRSLSINYRNFNIKGISIWLYLMVGLWHRYCSADTSVWWSYSFQQWNHQRVIVIRLMIACPQISSGTPITKRVSGTLV